MHYKYRITSPLPWQWHPGVEKQHSRYAQLHFFFLLPVSPRPTWKTATEYQSQDYTRRWPELGPEPRRQTQQKQQTQAIGTTLGSASSIMDFAITLISDCLSRTWSLVTLQKCRWILMFMSHLLLKYFIIRFCSSLRAYAVYIRKWKKSPSRKK